MQLDGADVFKTSGRAGRGDRGQQLGGRLGRPHALHPAGAQLHEEADRAGGPPDLRRPRRLPQRLAAKNYDYQTVEYTATVKPAEKADLLYEILQHQGRNAKQNSVDGREGRGEAMKRGRP